MTEQGKHEPSGLIGIALDVSGSMHSSIQNNQALDVSRIGGVQNAMNEMIGKSRALAAKYGPQADVNLRFFCNAFGTVCDPGHVDLLALLALVSDQAADSASAAFLKNVIDRRKQEAMAEGERLRNQAASYSGLAGLATAFGLGGIVSSYARDYARDAEERLREQALKGICSDVMDYIEKTYPQGLVLSLPEIADLWSKVDLNPHKTSASEDDVGIDAFIFGSTPMCECLRTMRKRFEWLMKQPGSPSTIPGDSIQPDGTETPSLLILISDGASTDGNPEGIAQAIKALGVTVLCIYLTDSDVHSPKDLPAAMDKTWDSGARHLFEMASTVGNTEETNALPWKQTLQASGWTVDAASRLFVQINHSETLADLLRIVAMLFPAKDLPDIIADITTALR